VGKSSL